MNRGAAEHLARRALARAALAQIPKLLTLQDRTPVSPAYGCFDRSYWHYRTMDFPCGMSQEFSLPLALAWALDMPENPYHRQPEIRRWSEAGIRYACRSAHPDGACDDYYPYERAAGAAAFSLFACLEAASLLGLRHDPEISAFAQRRAHWLASRLESGKLSNHEALIVASLARLAEEDRRWEAPLRRRLARLLSWQSGEGWFIEYGGADPGYLSLTISLLADVDRRRPDLDLRGAIRRAVRFLAVFVHPDGSVGGGYTSRGTCSFFPHGLEIAGIWLPDALAINDLALRPLVEGRAPCYADDRIIGHHLWSWMLSWAEWQPNRPAKKEEAGISRTFPEARLLRDVRGATRLYYSWGKGGAFKLYKGRQLLWSDTGPCLALRDGRVAVTHLQENGIHHGTAHDLNIRGHMVWTRQTRLTPLRSAGLRLAMLLGGRLAPDVVRRMLQFLLVTGRRPAPFRFQRRLVWNDGAWDVTDTIWPEQGWGKVAAVGVGGFQISIATAMAQVWQPEQLQPWLDWSPLLNSLESSAPLVVSRRLGAGNAWP